MNIEEFLDSPESLLTLCQNVISALDDKKNDSGLNEKEKQLREISRSIEKLERQGVSVPEQLRSLKSTLIIELAGKDEINKVFEKLANGFDSILKDLYARVDRPYEVKNSKTRTKHSKKPKTPRETLRAEIIHVLKMMGGRGSPSEVEEAMEKRLKSKLLPRDLETLTTGEIVWKNTAEWERFRMVKEGILKSNSPHGVWELKEEYL
jgi:hypothetical protein